ncbi:MAG: SAM-dependent methyltransferase [Salinivirgaceae bacterium]|nr:MAG: SAM-dependent methyltransferase [Salinivirgaceae bacterium]
MKEFWDQRYGNTKYAYGEEPNSWFKYRIDGMKPGKILLPGEGEGRNGIYAARLGWEVHAFDQSIEGKRKAEKLAQKYNVEIDYKVGELTELAFDLELYDAVSLVFTHFAPGLREKYHRLLGTYLKRGGRFIIEGFSKEQLSMISESDSGGGPKNIDMLYSIEELQHDFADYDIKELRKEIVHLDEGIFHNGMSSVIRFDGRKS